MPRQILIIIVFVFGCLSGSLIGQNITVINHYGDTTGMGNVAFSLQESQQHTILINYYKPASSDEISRLEELIGSALDFYIDQMVDIGEDGVSLLKSRNTVLREMNEIVTTSFKLYGFRDPKQFAGFSDRVEAKIRDIETLDLKKGDWNKLKDAEARAQFRFHYVQTELNDLKSLVNTEVGNFPTNNLMVVAGSDVEVLSPEEQAALMAEIEGFEKHDPLDPIQFEFSESTITLLASEDQFLLPDYTSNPEPKRDDDFALKVLAMLEENNRKLNDLSKEVSDLRVQQERDKLENEVKRNDQMQGQIDDLRELILSIVKEDQPTIVLPPSTSGIANLPQSVSINFTAGGIAVYGANQFVLNEVVDLLAHHPRMKVMVTGYADKTGNAQSNLLISQKRAKAVRQYLLRSGLSDDRVMMNYFGDRDSDGASADDRKVVIEFLQY